MESNQNDYHISFFKPTTKQARWNRNLVIVLVLIWTVAIFGFQYLLKITVKPTPEQAFIQYESVWDNVNNESANIEEMQSFAHCALSVLGKVFIKPESKMALNNAVSWTTFQLADSSQKILLKERLLNFETIKSGDPSITDPDYIASKNGVNELASEILGIEKTDVRAKFVALELKSAELEVFTPENKEIIPETMSLYLIHNQSFLTDFKFLGFPFHYFYTAVFLLVLFVFLCWLYCVRVDKMNVKLDIEEL